MKTIFDKEVPKSRFEKWVQKYMQKPAMIAGLLFFAYVFIRIVFNF